MNIQYRIKNFKAFADTGSLDLTPVTIFCGANSSGKSSILKSLLLVKQSAAERRSATLANAPAQPLLLNGEWTKLGSWSDTVHGRQRGEAITIAWTTDASQHESSLFSGLLYSMLPHKNDSAPIRMHYEVEIRSDEDEREELSSYLYTAKLKSETCEVSISSATAQNSRIGLYKIAADNLGAMIRAKELGRRPSYIRSNTEIGRVLSKSDENMPLGHVDVTLSGPFISNLRAVIDSSWIPFLERLSLLAHRQRIGKPGPSPKWLNQFDRSVRQFREASVNPNVADALFDFEIGFIGSLIQSIVGDANAFFEHQRKSASPLYSLIRYLGPLRYQPQRFYQFDDTGGVDIGVSGEYTVQVLALERHKTVHLRRIVRNEDGSIALGDVEYISLLEATNYWLSQMGLPDVTTSPLWQSLYELKLGESGHALPDVGFGVSQVLPIIVECLRAQKGDTVLLEQPEIHLHPSIQAILADFFIERASEGVRFIVETHSEYMVKRLCRRVAESTIEEISQTINVFFVGRGLHGSAECKEIVVNEFGEVKNWPKGFFDSNEDMYWAKASLKRRAAASRTLR